MDELKNRGKSQESRFALEQELRFKAEARRNKLLGLWAADLMGMSESEAKDYAAEVIRSDFEEPGDEDVFRKIRGDFDARNIDKSDHQIRRTMDELMSTAIKQIKNEA